MRLSIYERFIGVLNLQRYWSAIFVLNPKRNLPLSLLVGWVRAGLIWFVFSL